MGRGETMKAIALILLGILVSSCTYSFDRYWEIRQEPEVFKQGNLALSSAIKEAFPFIHDYNIPPRKGKLDLCGTDGSMFVILTVQEGLVVVMDLFDEGKYMSEKEPEFSEFIKKLKELMEQNGAQVIVSEPVRHFGIHWE